MKMQLKLHLTDIKWKEIIGSVIKYDKAKHMENGTPKKKNA
jgi:hypothetical protein